MKFRVTTPPASEPLTVAEVLKHSRISDQGDNAYIAALITKARDWIERTQHRALWTQTITVTLDAFPSSRAIELERPPLVSVTSISYLDGDGASQAFTSFAVDDMTEPGRIVLDSGASWPDTSDEPNAVTIVYQAGYTAQTFPPAYKHAICLLVAHWYDNREPSVIGTITAALPFSLQSLLDSCSWGNYR